MSSSKFMFAVLIYFSVISCSDYSTKTQTALNLADSNKVELEKVLNHYKYIDTNSLKFKAAEYLIQNMIYQYSVNGSNVDSINNNFKRVYGSYYKDRNAIYRSDTIKSKLVGEETLSLDIEKISSNQLIEQIESAFKVYEKFEWCKKYPLDLFLEYILPYKINEHSPILWRDYGSKKYGDLLNHHSINENGNILQAENFTNDERLKINLARLSNKLGYNLKPDFPKLTFNFKIGEEKMQSFNIYYLNNHNTGARVKVFIDGDFKETLYLPATGDPNIIDRDVPPIKFISNLKKGEHTLELSAIDKNVIIDYLAIPDLIEMKLPQAFVASGDYILRTSIGEITFSSDSLIDESNIKLEAKPKTKSLVKVVPKDGNLYQFVLEQKSGETKAIDAFPFDLKTRVLIYKNHGYQNQLWSLIPYKNIGYKIINKETGKILAFSDKDSSLVQIPSQQMSDKYIWNLNLVNSESQNSDISVKVAQKISDITDQFQWSGSGSSLGPINPINLLDHPYGTCVEETDYQTMVLRSLGIACTTDFVMNYPERDAGHSWSVIFDHNGNTIQNNCHNPVGSGTWVDVFAKGKVYRKTNSINPNSLFIKNNGKEMIPNQFKNAYMKDVTTEYCNPKNIKVKDLTASSNTYGYLLVFNNDNWTPIGWGEKSEDSIFFENFEADAMYLPAVYENGSFKAINAPFYVDSLGKNHYFKISDSLKSNFILKRKFPNRLVSEALQSKIIGGKFQGANKSDFSDAITIGTITNNMIEPMFHSMEVNKEKSFKFLRYIGPDNGYCNISEIVFFDKNNNKLDGKVIGTEGSFEDSDRKKENAFDGNVLTYFDSPNGSGDWVGLELNNPTGISKIRFAARNDGNMVEVGDEYELVYWNGDWISAGTQIAKSDSLVFKDVPINTLYVLHNKTKGWEERIFSYDRGAQKWW